MGGRGGGPLPGAPGLGEARNLLPVADARPWSPLLEPEAYLLDPPQLPPAINPRSAPKLLQGSFCRAISSGVSGRRVSCHSPPPPPPPLAHPPRIATAANAIAVFVLLFMIGSPKWLPNRRARARAPSPPSRDQEAMKESRALRRTSPAAP